MHDDNRTANGMDRREVLRLIGAGALAALLPSLSGPAGEAQAAPAPSGGFERAKGPGVIFVVGDGMPAGVTRALHAVRTGVFGQANTAYHARLRARDSVVGLAATASLSSLVTDSAPASAAWSTGVKTANRYLAALPDGRKLTTIMELVKEKGVGTGFVTTTRVTHATPAAWVSHQTHRDEEDAIAQEFLAFRPDVLLGGGRAHFDGTKRKDGRDLVAAFASAGYDTALDKNSLAALPDSKKPLLGLFSGSHMAYNLDRLNDPALSGQPSLPEMTAAALRRLARHPGGFLLQVEAGRIDHASHANDAWGAIMDAVELDDTLAVIDAFLAVNPKTLVIVTSDHGNSGWGVNGTGPEYNDATAALRSYGAGKASFEALIRRMKGRSAAEIRDILAESTGFPMGHEDAERVLRAMEPGYAKTTGDYVYQPDATLGQILAHSSYPTKGAPPAVRRGNVGFTSCNHTAEEMVLLSYGHRARELCPGRLVENTELFGVLCRFFGVAHQNPTMTLAQARPHLLAARAADPRLHIA